MLIMGNFVSLIAALDDYSTIGRQSWPTLKVRSVLVATQYAHSGNNKGLNGPKSPAFWNQALHIMQRLATQSKCNQQLSKKNSRMNTTYQPAPASDAITFTAIKETEKCSLSDDASGLID